MRDDYLDEKLEDINSKNISKEEKKEKIKKQKRNNVIIICFIVLFLLCFFSQLSFEKNENLLIYYEYIIYIEIFLLISFCIYLALISKEGKKSRKKRSWKNIKSQESDSLQDLCEHICDNAIEELLPEKNKAKKTKRIAILSILALWLLSYWVFNVAGDAFMIIYFLLCIGITIKVISDAVKAKQKYKSVYKKIVVNSFINTICPDMQYSENEPSYSRVKIDYNYIDFDDVYDKGVGARTRTEDYFAEYIDTIDLEMAEVFSCSNSRKRSVVFFKGMFAILNTNKEYEKLEIKLKRFKPFDKKQIITIDNQRFNKYFKVHAIDDANWSKILTDDLITFLTDFREKYNIDFEIIFKEKVYIRFYTTNMFEPRMRGKIVDEYSVYQFYVINKFIKEFSARLKKSYI